MNASNSSSSGSVRNQLSHRSVVSRSSTSNVMIRLNSARVRNSGFSVSFGYSSPGDGTLPDTIPASAAHRHADPSVAISLRIVVARMGSLPVLCAATVHVRLQVVDCQASDGEICPQRLLKMPEVYSHGLHSARCNRAAMHRLIALAEVGEGNRLRVLGRRFCYSAVGQR